LLYVFILKTSSRSRSKKLELRDTIVQGNYDDVEYLTQCLQRHSEGRGGPTFAFTVDVPATYEKQAAKRFKAWLENIGFTEALFGEKTVLRLAVGKVKYEFK